MPASFSSRNNQLPTGKSLRIGAVNYLNTKPLVYGLERLLPEACFVYDLPSRLADALAAGELDIALVPSVELARHPDWKIVSDACIACRGPVLSVKMMFRIAPARVRSLSLDEGSRTSAMLAQVLLQKIHGVRPRLEMLPIGAAPATANTDAVLVIGDKAIQSENQSGVEVWDLGDRWCRWAERPFVFAMWVARAGVDATPVARVLAAARDDGCRHLAEIAQLEAAAMRLPRKLVLDYFRRNLHFQLGASERGGLEYFFAQVAWLEAANALQPAAPSGVR